MGRPERPDLPGPVVDLQDQACPCGWPDHQPERDGPAWKHCPELPLCRVRLCPHILTATTSTYIHRQVSGSNTTPAGAGNGRESTDRSNFVQLVSNDIGANYVAYAKNITQTGKVV